VETALRTWNLDMPIVLYRIDERLIHGQVVVGWVNSLGVDRIVLANDKVASNPWERELYLACVPPEIKATILSMDQAIRKISNDGFRKEKTIFLIDSPFDILRMLGKRVKIDCINVGGIHYKEGRKRILPYLYLSPSEISAFKKLFFLGIRCECQDVPLAEKKELSGLFEKLRL
jgi:mannose/fructose/N-acetylgalactosamine-specific phosphotransferase system component IIB